MEEKRFSGRNWLVLAAVVIVIALVAVFAATPTRQINPTGGQLVADPQPTEVVATEAPATEVPAVTEAPAATEAPAEEPAATNAPAEAYLVVVVAGTMYEPIPLYGSGRYTVTRGDHVNVIEVTADSVWMAESSCDNQDCVEQGVVSLENKSSRVLQNMVLCLPNEVVLELYSRDELVNLLLSMIAEEEAAGE